MTTYTSEMHNGGTLRIWSESGGCRYEVFDSGGERVWGHPLTGLSDLRTLIQRRDPFDLDNLPTFGGATPDDTTEVWSWDETSLLVGTCAADLEIVNRQDW